MSSLADIAMTSDGPAPFSTASDGPGTASQEQRAKAAERRRLGRSSTAPRSSSRPRGPPSASAHPESEDEISLDDDQIAVQAALRRRNQRNKKNIDPVVDQIGVAVEKRMVEFLENFVEDIDERPPGSAPPSTDRYYVEQVHGMAQYELSTLYVDYTHLLSYQQAALADAVILHYYRFQPFMTRALNSVIQRHEPRYYRNHRQPDSTQHDAPLSSQQRSQGTSETDPDSNVANASDRVEGRTLNMQTDKIFTLAFYNLPSVSRIRQLRTESIGRLSSVSGTVTRTSEVRPELHLGAFTCEACGAAVYNIEQTFRYTEPTQCANLTCNNRNAWKLDVSNSTFLDWQKIRVQENSAEIPTGSMPRTLDVIVRGEIVDRAKAGEKCIFTGTLIVVPDVSQFRIPGQTAQSTRAQANQNGLRNGEIGSAGVTGLKDLGVRDLTYRLAFLACMVAPDLTAAGQLTTEQNLSGQANNILQSLNQVELGQDPHETGEKAQAEFLQQLTQAEIDDLRTMVHTPHIYSRLVNSLAPMVYGHEVVKKGLLLQLLGGVSKITPEGMALRGDINICVVGDPSTSKSQFLKYITSIHPRAVYTSGKASSAAGLTAAVVKDEETGDHTIEAGALMLADNGICAIDEFDKMELADQVAIHEAMEQQTISIAKAGIQATLNARTSILAAANPVGGRYDRRTTLRANVNMSAPIMSRFDLFFVVLDECNEAVDTHLARHIVSIHQLRDDAVEPEFSTAQLQRYIRFARTFKPEFTPEAKVRLVARYKELRADDAQGGVGRNSYRITVRQLESLIRLSEAVAKANCVTEISEAFVDEAFGLLRQSIISVEREDVDVDDDDDEADDTQAGRNAMAGLDEDEEEDDDAANTTANGPRAPSARERTTVTYDKYQSIVRELVTRIQADEASSGRGVSEDDLLVWYIEQHEHELDSEEDARREYKLASKVAKRMVKENVLMLLRGEGLVNDSGVDEDGRQRGDEGVVYVLHPNAAVEDIVGSTGAGGVQASAGSAGDDEEMDG